MVWENAAVCWLVHPVSHVFHLLPAEEEPLHLRRGPVVQKPVAENEYLAEAVVGHPSSQGRKWPGHSCKHCARRSYYLGTRGPFNQCSRDGPEVFQGTTA